MAVPGERHPAFEEYCECIFELAVDDVAVIRARIAERLNVSRPAVSEMIRRLEAEGLIHTDGSIQLTAEGQALAQRTVRRHRLAERFLTDMLGLSWAEAHHEAGKWDVMSEAVEDAMDRVLGNPTTCPHGNPIPEADYEAPDQVTLAELPVRQRSPCLHRRNWVTPACWTSGGRPHPARAVRRAPAFARRLSQWRSTAAVGVGPSPNRILVVV